MLCALNLGASVSITNSHLYRHSERGEGSRVCWQITLNKRDVIRSCEVPRRLRGSG